MKNRTIESPGSSGILPRHLGGARVRRPLAGLLPWLILLAVVTMGSPWRAPAAAPVAPTTVSNAPTTAPAALGDAQTYARFVADLAGPAMEGRGNGAAGATRARDYLVKRYQEMGLSGAFAGGYTQPFQLGMGLEVKSQSIRVLGKNRQPVLSPRAGADFWAVGLADAKVSGPVVFVGYGTASPGAHYDSYSGLGKGALEGKIALVLRYEPQDASGKSLWGQGSWSPAASIFVKARQAQQHGAKALLLVNPPSHAGDSVAHSAGTYGSSIPVFQVSPGWVRQLLAVAGEKDATKVFADFQADADKGAIARPLEGLTAELEMRAQSLKADAANVAAVLPGAGGLAAEAVVVGAHYDHLGLAEGPGDRTIFPGADDNASGVAGTLLLAKWAADPRGTAQAPRNRRTVLFVNFAGEELGMLGSHYFVANLHQALPQLRVVAMINLDMIGRLREDRLQIYGTDSGRGWDEVVQAARSGCGLNVWSGGSANGPSDHASFYAAKIPAIEFFTGMHADVHRPTDTPDKINSSGAVKVLHVARRVLEATMVRDTGPAYAPSKDAPAVFLGITLEHGAGAAGVQVGRVMPQSPADRAGLKEGDVILRWDGKALGDTSDLFGALSVRKPGDKVPLRVRRGQGELDLTVTLEARSQP